MPRLGGDRERSRSQFEVLYELEMVLREEGDSDFAYDEEHDLFRFSDGRFVFSKEGKGRGALLQTWLLRVNSCRGCLA